MTDGVTSRAMPVSANALLCDCHGHLHKLTAILPFNDAAYGETTALMERIRGAVPVPSENMPVPSPAQSQDDELVKRLRSGADSLSGYVAGDLGASDLRSAADRIETLRRISNEAHVALSEEVCRTEVLRLELGDIRRMSDAHRDHAQELNEHAATLKRANSLLEERLSDMDQLARIHAVGRSMAEETGRLKAALSDIREMVTSWQDLPQVPSSLAEAIVFRVDAALHKAPEG